MHVIDVDVVDIGLLDVGGPLIDAEAAACLRGLYVAHQLIDPYEVGYSDLSVDVGIGLLFIEVLF